LRRQDKQKEVKIDDERRPGLQKSDVRVEKSRRKYM